MPVVYASVLRGTGPFLTLADHATYSGNFAEVGTTFLDRAAAEGRLPEGGKFTFATNGYDFCYLRQGYLVCMVVADQAYGRVVPVALLDRLSLTVSQLTASGTANEAALRANLGLELRRLVEHATLHPEQYSKVASVQKMVNEVKVVLAHNIDLVLVRGEKLEQLADKTEDLTFESERFVRTSRTLARKMRWQNCKVKLVVLLAVLLLGVVIFLLVCFSGGNCLKK